MKKTFIVLCLAIAAIRLAYGQTDENYLLRYSLLISRVGFDGVGVETLLDKWEQADSKDINAKVARYNFYYEKCQRDTVIKSSAKKLFGQSPAFSLKDTSGRQINYYNEVLFDEALFHKAMSALDEALEIDNTRLDIYFIKLNALVAYEREKPEKSCAFLEKMIQKNYKGGSPWKYPGKEIDEDYFCTKVQGYCKGFFEVYTPASLEAFRRISQVMLKHRPKNIMFLDNMGTYSLIVERDSQKALKYYRKALKENPADPVATKNISLIINKSGALSK